MNSKYPNGYLPKIQYWQYKVNRYINEGDMAKAEYAVKKLSHFIIRQCVVENQMEYTPTAPAGYPASWR